MNKNQLKYYVALVFTGIIFWGYFFLFERQGINEFWIAWLLNIFYFMMISLFGYLFLSFHILAKTSWHFPIQTQLLTSGKMILVLILLFLPLLWKMNDFFPWIHNTELQAGKEWYLNPAFLKIRTMVTLALWVLPGIFLSKRIQNPGKLTLDFYAGIITVFYIVSFIIFTHDWLLTLCCDWHSTLFAWYIFSGLLLTGISFTAILFLFSGKSRVKTITDISKYLFSFTCIWMYLWYSQFMLIWYTNIQHETFYISRQFFHYQSLFYANLIFSFGIPFVLLFTTLQKKSSLLLGISSVSVLIGQWINLYINIYPVLLPDSKSFILPIAIFILFLLIFLFPFVFKKIELKIKPPVSILFLLLCLSSCNFSKTNPGFEYFPTMTYSSSYETYSVNPNFTDSATMRNPVKGTVPREFIPFQFEKTAEARIAAGLQLTNPLDSTDANVSEGKFLYTSFCLQCHGEKGDGMGKLYTEKFYTYKPGVLNGDKIQNAPEGEIFHAISVGFNLMGAHKTILLPEERWKLVFYIQTLN